MADAVLLADLVAVDEVFAAAMIVIPPGEYERRTLTDCSRFRRDRTTNPDADGVIDTPDGAIKSTTSGSDKDSMAQPPPNPHARAADQSITIPGRQETVLIYAGDPERSTTIAAIVESAGWLALTPTAVDDAVRILDTAPPDVCLLVVTEPSGDELMVLDHARAGVGSEQVPIVCLLDRRHRPLVLDAFGRRADDVIWGDPDPDELIARLRTRIERPPVPRSRLIVDPVTGALTSDAFEDQLRKEHERVNRGGRPGSLAYIAFDELPELTARYGSRARDELLAQVVRLVQKDGRKLDFIGWRRGMVAILLPSTPTKGAQIRFDRLVHKIYHQEFMIAGSAIRLTPVIGFTETVDDVTLEEYEDRVWDATRYQSDQLDLHPTRWVGAMSPNPENTSTFKRWFERIRTPFQVVSQQIAAARDSVRHLHVARGAGNRHHGLVVHRLRDRTCRHRDQHPDRVPRRGASDRTTAGTRRSTAACLSDHRRLPAERGRDDHRDRRGISQPGLSGPRGDRRIQHTEPSRRRGRVARKSQHAIPGSSRSASTARSPRPRTSTLRWHTYAASSSACSTPIIIPHPVRSTGRGGGWQAEPGWCRATA